MDELTEEECNALLAQIENVLDGDLRSEMSTRIIGVLLDKGVLA